MASVEDIPPALRDDLIAYLLCDSPDRARIIAELLQRNPGMGDLLADLEADDELRAKLEMALIRGRTGSRPGSPPPMP
jgi:hypothetical protein